MSEPRRWTIYRLGDYDWHLGEPERAIADHPQCEQAEVMPVEEHEALREAAREADALLRRLDEWDQMNVKGGDGVAQWKGEIAKVRAALGDDTDGHA